MSDSCLTSKSAELYEKQSPSLRPYLQEAIEEAYESGLDLAVGETLLGYEAFPQECPYSQEQILDTSFPLDPKASPLPRD